MKQNPNAEILVLDEEGTNLGRMPYRDAQDLATSRNLDLVNVNKRGDVEVFKIMDHGKWKYDKKKHKQKKSTHVTKEVNFKMRIDPHDQEIKINRIKSFLEKGADVKIMVTMRGREKANPRLAHDKMDQILGSFGEDMIQIQQRRGSPSAIYATIRPVPGYKSKSQKAQNSQIDEPDPPSDESSKKDHDFPKMSDELEPAYVYWRTVRETEAENNERSNRYQRDGENGVNERVLSDPGTENGKESKSSKTQTTS